MAQQASLNPQYSSWELSEALFDNWLRRNSKSHNRPTAELPLYTKILEEISAIYAVRVGPEGYFLVGIQDLVEVEHNGQTYRFDVWGLLKRSGIIFWNKQIFRPDAIDLTLSGFNCIFWSNVIRLGSQAII